ncbi:MAG: sirohydrochlorin cobaltochelatase [Schaedlerella sp.]|nr:sirohydrochlorin cobaltochelatase [Schaedlerella sp.]
MKEKMGVILVCYGNASKEGRRKTIDAMEMMLKEKFTDCWVTSAFTSQYIINKVKEREGIMILSFEEAVKAAAEAGVNHLLVQQFHLANGYIGNGEMFKIEKYKKSFQSISVGKHLLEDEEDIKRVSSIIIDEANKEMDDKTAVCFIGHGTESNETTDYVKLQEEIWKNGYKNCFIGTLHGEPTCDSILLHIKGSDYKRTLLIPLILTVGYHVNKNIVGDDADSWKVRFESEGYEVKCMMSGLGENKQIRAIFLEHAIAAWEKRKLL